MTFPSESPVKSAGVLAYALGPIEVACRTVASLAEDSGCCSRQFHVVGARALSGYIEVHHSVDIEGGSEDVKLSINSRAPAPVPVHSFQKIRSMPVFHVRAGRCCQLH
jgi:hypothetical protein